MKPLSQKSPSSRPTWLPDVVNNCSISDIQPTDSEPVAAYYDDFECWCEECVTIADKLTGAPVPFRLNAPQRRLARTMEKQRRSGKPVRIILLKARQWGGSTLVQAYLAWHQLVRHRSRNALICAHVKDAAAIIRSTYSTLINSYPDHLKQGEPALWKLKPYQQTQGTLWIPARDACISITSANNPDALRSGSFHLAHLSEAAFWGDGDIKAASAIARTVCGSIPSVPETVIVIESTADGPDNWFAAEWRRAVAGKSDKEPIFVPWHEIEIYRKPLSSDQRKALPATLDDYELRLLAQGVKAEAIAWYHDKRREYSTHTEMMAEFPSTPEEAFATSRRSPFPPINTDILLCTDPTPPKFRAPTSLTVATLAEKLLLSRFEARDGKIHALADTAAPDVRTLMRIAASQKEPSGEFAIIEAPPPGSPAHGPWCLRFARTHSLPLCYRAEEPLLTVTDRLLSEMIDLHLHLLNENLLRDTNPAAVEAYRLFDITRPWQSAIILSRLAASLLLEAAVTAAPISPSDFLNL